MYADDVTDSMKPAISETQRRRKIQLAYNVEHDIDPQTIRKKRHRHPAVARRRRAAAPTPKKERRRSVRRIRRCRTEELERLIRALEEEMHEAAKDLRFEYAARLRDEVVDLRKELKALRAGRGRASARESCRPVRPRATSAWLGPGPAHRGRAGRLRRRADHVRGLGHAGRRGRRGVRRWTGS